MTKNKNIGFSWSEGIEEGVSDEVQTVLDKDKRRISMSKDSEPHIMSLFM